MDINGHHNMNAMPQGWLGEDPLYHLTPPIPPCTTYDLIRVTSSLTKKAVNVYLQGVFFNCNPPESSAGK